MDSIHALFATYVLPGRQIPGDLTPAQPQRTTPDADPFHSGGRIYELIRRVHILHHQARQERTLTAQTISQALQVWNELERWDPSEGTSTPEQFRLNNAYRSAIFIWTYFTIYPRDIHGWKPQDAVRDILADVPAVGDDGELVRLAGIPLFFCALSVTDEGERGVIRSEYERVRQRGGRGLDASWGIVQRQWRRYDAGDRESWDWVE
ncbi:hypothetical protein ASPVEDRAFT_82826 [Aspergillus versicolor CBS 583.65]|uniref:Uncharacterized protein n=1 Tax=Aspergillus versicolor CBS 583.65 TaxID=1036611 RepID=A0A1L9PIH9_ASPVE|nr:uncharacterized protein ASPVEDRAFT_82826 [Aspergillus versicolor CBS 583.65]OJJ01301.1 hypothetical protein ASPVEDRAFT_82826 [Aspergillus versicolor CBS 583.65]